MIHCLPYFPHFFLRTVLSWVMKRQLGVRIELEKLRCLLIRRPHRSIFVTALWKLWKALRVGTCSKEYFGLGS